MSSGVMKLDISPVNHEMRGVLSPDLNRLIPCNDDGTRPIKDILEFPVRDIYEPHNSYM